MILDIINSTLNSIESKKDFSLDDIDLEEVFCELFKLSIKYSEAEKGYLVIVKDNNMYFKKGNDMVFIEEMVDIYREILYYVKRRLETVIINDGENDFKHNKNSYIIKNRIKSLLCMPITYNDKLIALLYLEHRTKTFVFNNDKVKIIKFLWKHTISTMEDKMLNYKNKKRDEALEYQKLKKELILNISHELKTPINVIHTALQMCNLVVDDSENNNSALLKTYFNIMRKNCYRLLRIADNTLDISSIDSGCCELNIENIDIVSLIENITMSSVQYAKAKGIELIFDTDVEERYLACDGNKIEKIMLNLLSNALKFTKKGGQVLVKIKDRNDYIYISVKDTGIGIKSDKIDAIFDKFEQADRSLCRKNEGSGIGLPLVKALAEIHNGKVWVNSEYGKGSEFIVKLPIKNCTMENHNFYHFTDLDKIKIEFSDIYL
ncbi:GAF domain-containing sensor histidine kinase [Clostridium sp. MSJ-11]|uniref:histidine kinase n=1 Tax=Clostridium mobile TaxID=2841512 RepID=A0ABS6EFR6_9CLOT|nr:GAF domain-containing sensor histidine kinase [Clostridium mobile]MBU5483868.1 GAF domain-containing sensor histidine kinase [Clostridium mobile]